MTPLTLVIDRNFRGVGRIKKATGTTKPAVRRNISRMLTALHDDGRLDILRAIRDGKLIALQVYDAYQRKTLQTLPLGETMAPLAATMKAWIEDAKPDYSAKHIENHVYAQRAFAKIDASATVADLPRVLEELRTTYGRRHPRSFNIYRASALSFTRSTLKRSHAIYVACLAIEERKVTPRKAGAALSVQAIEGYFPSPDTNKVDRIAWSLVTTGMGLKEYFGTPWSIQADRIHISGTKRGGRDRDIPLVRPPSLPVLSRDRFQRVFRERMKESGVTPYQLRRTYMQWLEAAGIPRTRRKLYMGHGVKDVSDLYERHEVTTFLVADAKLLDTFIHTKAHTIDAQTTTDKTT